MLNIKYFGDLWVNEVCVYFLRRLDLKIKIKNKYNYTDSALMG